MPALCRASIRRELGTTGAQLGCSSLQRPFELRPSQAIRNAACPPADRPVLGLGGTPHAEARRVARRYPAEVSTDSECTESSGKNSSRTPTSLRVLFISPIRSPSETSAARSIASSTARLTSTHATALSRNGTRAACRKIAAPAGRGVPHERIDCRRPFRWPRVNPRLGEDRQLFASER